MSADFRRMQKFSYSVALRGQSKRECGFLTPRFLARRHDCDARAVRGGHPQL